MMLAKFLAFCFLVLWANVTWHNWRDDRWLAPALGFFAAAAVFAGAAILFGLVSFIAS